MNLKTKVKLIIDVAMSITLFVSLSYQFMEQKNHEIAGAVMLVFFVLHHVMNYKWYTALVKGKYTAQRVLLTVTDFCVLIDMLLLMISGIRMSRYVFDFINLNFSMELARNLHMVCSYLGFLLMGFHIGLHYAMILGMIRKAFHITEKNALRTWILRVLALLISAYGIYALLKRNFLSYITLKMHFVFFDYSKPVIFYILDLMAIMILMIFLGYYAQRGLIRLQRKNKS